MSGLSLPVGLSVTRVCCRVHVLYEINARPAVRTPPLPPSYLPTYYSGCGVFVVPACSPLPRADNCAPHRAPFPTTEELSATGGAPHRAPFPTNEESSATSGAPL